MDASLEEPMVSMCAKHVSEHKHHEKFAHVATCSKWGALAELQRLRQIKRHLKVTICAMATILRLLLFARILYCWQIMLQVHGRVQICRLADYVKEFY